MQAVLFHDPSLDPIRNKASLPKFDGSETDLGAGGNNPGLKDIGVRRGVSKRVENGCRSPALRAGQPRNGCKAVSGWPTRRA
jgi:hypothetical protein